MGLSKYSIIKSDVIEWAKDYSGPPFMALLCDPPYHLVSINKRFGKPGSKPAKGDVYHRASKGFMSVEWDGLGEDGQGIAFKPETWEVLAQHLYPGAFIMAFASSRGWHRLACAIEDAGLIIHPSFFQFWNYLSGFPKATRVKGDSNFDGHRYGGQCIKPAIEPIIVAQKPYIGRPVDNITETGAGALWIDGGRIETGESWNGRITGNGEAVTVYGDGLNNRSSSSHSNGRWPSNLVLVHHPLCNGTCHPDCAVRALDEQSGESVSTRSMRGELADIRGDNYGRSNGARLPDSDSERGYHDSGPASRMFHQADWSHEVMEQLANATPLHYEPKASSAEREAGLAHLETVTRHRVNAGGLENEPRFAPTEVKNNHPTVKSISLTKYLATLLLPPMAYAPRRILVPFAGVGSEMIGATLAGWEEVTGIERESAYVDIARARLEWWSDWLRFGQDDPKAILKADDEPAQIFMF